MLGFPIGVINAFRIIAIAAGSFASVQSSHTNCSTQGADNRGRDRDRWYESTERQ
jgi:hypothetical protein